jgi:hypothetical protein
MFARQAPSERHQALPRDIAARLEGTGLRHLEGSLQTGPRSFVSACSCPAPALPLPAGPAPPASRCGPLLIGAAPPTGVPAVRTGPTLFSPMPAARPRPRP